MSELMNHEMNVLLNVLQVAILLGLLKWVRHDAHTKRTEGNAPRRTVDGPGEDHRPQRH